MIVPVGLTAEARVAVSVMLVPTAVSGEAWVVIVPAEDAERVTDSLVSLQAPEGRYTVLGNITAGEILAQQAPLTAPWMALNVQSS